MQTKAENQERHAIQRAKERYGLDLDQGHYRELCNRIRYQREGVKYIGRQSHRVSVWGIEHGGQRLLAIYDRDRHRISTFLPADIEDAKGVSVVPGAEGGAVAHRQPAPALKDTDWPPPGVVPLGG